MSSMILNQRSPALVSILPRPEENSKQLFNRKKTAQTKLVNKIQLLYKHTLLSNIFCLFRNIEPDVMINQVVEDNNNNEEFEEDDDGDEYETLNE